MTTFLTALSRLAGRGLLWASLATAAASDQLSVWVDDAQTRRIDIERLDPEEIADPRSFSLGVGHGVGNVGVSIGWSRKKGIEYTERVQRVLDRLRSLCKEFNRGEMSLETYQRRQRDILGALDHARVLAMELQVHTTLAAAEAGERLNEAVGLESRDAEPFKQEITAALSSFESHVNGLPQPLPEDAARSASELVTILDRATALARGETAAEERLTALDRCLASEAEPELAERERVYVWKDASRSERILVPKLDVENLVQDFEESLGLRLKYSAPLVTQYVGPRTTWLLERRAEYDQAAQLLIVKYRRLCLDYNGGILTQQDYIERLLELMEAERRAFDAREQLIETLNERKDEMRGELDQALGGDVPAWVREAKERSEAKRRGIPSKDDPKEPSAVAEMAEEHLREMAAWEAFAASVDALDVKLPGDTIRVRVRDDEERTVEAARLDTDLIAQNYETRLTLHISIFNFGPEAEWTRKRGLEYGELAQELIVKSKQLCADYNAGLVSMESYARRTAQIDASIEAAARVRESIVLLAQALKRDARANLKHLLEQLEKRKDGR